MASLIRKTINGRTYYYLATSARVDGKPRIVAQRYLGSADDLAAAADGGARAPTRTRHVGFGDVAACWGVLRDLDLVRLVDAVVGVRRAKVSPGTQLALAVLHQVVAPASDLDLAAWWPTTAASRFVRPRLDAGDLDRRRFWRTMERLEAHHLDEIEAALFPGPAGGGEPTGPVLALDVPAFATYTGADPAAASGARAPTRLAGLGLVVTLDGAVPVVSRRYEHPPGRPAATSFSALVEELAARYHALSGTSDGVTVVVDAGQSAQVDVGLHAGLHVVASLPPGEHPDLVARSAGRRAVDRDRFPGVSVRETRAKVAGTDRRVLVFHSRALRAAQERALAGDVASATRRLTELAAALSAGSVHRPREQVAAEIARITRFRFVDRVLSTTLTGTEPGELRLRWSVDEAARARLNAELFGTQVLVTDHEDWSAADVLTAYRARYRLESTLHRRGGAVVAAPVPGWRWNDRRVAVHAFVSVLATRVTHLMRRTAQRSGLDVSVGDLFAQLAGIEETVLHYPSTGGRPRTRRVLAEQDATQQRLFDLFQMQRYAPPG